jgi:hypothetical protein
MGREVGRKAKKRADVFPGIHRVVDHRLGLFGVFIAEDAEVRQISQGEEANEEGRDSKWSSGGMAPGLSPHGQRGVAQSFRVHLVGVECVLRK